MLAPWLELPSVHDRMQWFTTVAGIDLTVTKVDGVTYVDGNPILVQNVQATNGVIHVIGAVLVPES